MTGRKSRFRPGRAGSCGRGRFAPLALLLGQEGGIAPSDAVHATLEVLNATGAGDLLSLLGSQLFFVAIGKSVETVQKIVCPRGAPDRLLFLRIELGIIAGRKTFQAVLEILRMA